MANKDRRSISLDSDLNQRLQNENINVSEKANRLFREYLSSGDTLHAAVAVRRSEIDEEIADKREKIARLESQIETLQEEKAELKEMEDELHSSVDEAINEALRIIDNGEWNPQYNSPDNPVVQDLARQAGVTPERFSQMLEGEL